MCECVSVSVYLRVCMMESERERERERMCVRACVRVCVIDVFPSTPFSSLGVFSNTVWVYGLE